MPWQRWRKGNVSRPPANFGWTKSISHQVSDSILNVNTNHVKEIPKAPHPSVLCFPRRSQKQDGKSNVSRHPPYLPLCQIRPYQELRAQQELVWALCPLPSPGPRKNRARRSQKHLANEEAIPALSNVESLPASAPRRRLAREGAL